MAYEDYELLDKPDRELPGIHACTDCQDLRRQIAALREALSLVKAVCQAAVRHQWTPEETLSVAMPIIDDINNQTEETQ